MDGWAVLTALKADPELADIPVIMVTIVDDRNLGYALGAADYLTKPIDRERLVAVLGRYRRDARRSWSSRTTRTPRAGSADARAGGLDRGRGRERPGRPWTRLARRAARRDPARPDDAGDGRVRLRRGVRRRAGLARGARSSSSPPRTSPPRTTSVSTARSRASSRRARSAARRCSARCATSSPRRPTTAGGPAGRPRRATRRRDAA